MVNGTVKIYAKFPGKPSPPTNISTTYPPTRNLINVVMTSTTAPKLAKLPATQSKIFPSSSVGFIKSSCNVGRSRLETGPSILSPIGSLVNGDRIDSPGSLPNKFPAPLQEKHSVSRPLQKPLLLRI